ncbi:unnamed protein product [Euphydryas editha]|nr:unnamed protein product [Euphydryas editha]
MFIVCCYCLENNDLSILESRAKKKKTSFKLLGMILLFVLSKVAIFKTISVFVMMTFFQKLFTLAGILFKYYMKGKIEKQPVYGPPEYNTVGYSYGPPDESYQEGYPGKDVASSFDWLLNKNVK